MTKKIILCDMDGVLCDLVTKWLKAYNDEFGLSITEEQFLSKGNEVHEALGCGDVVYDIFKRPGFFSDLPPIPGAIDTIKKYVDEHYILIVTAISCCGEIAKGKYEWLDRYMPFFNKKDVIFCKRKELVYGDYLFEDSIKNSDRWLKQWQNGRCFILVNATNKKFLKSEHELMLLDELEPWKDIDNILAVINHRNKVSQ